MDLEADLVEVQLVESETAERSRCLLAEALPARCGIADEDPESRHAVVAVDRLETAVADVPVALEETDGERQLRRVLAAGRPLDPVGFLRERHRVALGEGRAERLVVHP